MNVEFKIDTEQVKKVVHTFSFAIHIGGLAVCAALANSASRKDEPFWHPFWIIVTLGLLFRFIRSLYLNSPAWKKEHP